MRQKTDGESFVVLPQKLTLSTPPMKHAGHRRHGFYFPQASTKLHCTDRPQDGSSLFFPNRESIEMNIRCGVTALKMSEAPLLHRERADCWKLPKR
jgi:hypothetical protein